MPIPSTDQEGLRIGCHEAGAGSRVPVEPDRSAQVLIFLHLLKTGGTTLNRIIEWEYSPLRICGIDPSFFRWSYRRLLRWPVERLAKIQVFTGHMPFGLHNHLSRPSTYMTVMRDPVERVISEYYFARTYVLHPRHRKVRQLSLEEYARSTLYHNIQTKLLAGQDSLYDFLAGECDADTLRIARQNLAEHFALIGLTERFDETLALAKTIFGWRVRNYANFNVTRQRPPAAAISQVTRDSISARNRSDVEL
jgi:hypothetical protein